ncbi:Crp/Fnr family transcriptional regulator [Phenylobacterium sp.]|jgi:CRP-like cAMP-binding protein|uniref:Crp/Fnr family transcriptional regulator n=1 Tax=Phenylobacterium sp. TaxID=1871053 RepID=UPI002E33D64B|nr:Crp/Fnr family transcriptional regulator [Phenylobacterium sp.]HEX2558773.1 Crp/Fnr family transcriptional regulator [Phenylobacterium sp.]
MTSALQPSPEHARLIRKFESVSRLGPSDIATLARLPLRTRSVEAGAEVVAQGATPTECCFVIEGWMCRYVMTREGGRQIVSFHIPGDLPDRDSLHLPHLDHSISAISSARVAFIPHAAVSAVLAHHPNIAVAFWRDAVVDAGVFRQWLTSLGRRDAKQRVAHLICEMFTRLEGLGLADSDHFHFPVTQTQLGDALGLSAVHINRTLQDLKASGAMSWKSSVVTIHDFDALRQVGDFDPAYLELRPMGLTH